MAISFDAKKNFAYSVVAVAPAPAASGTSLEVAPGDGSKFPTPPFNAVIWPTGVQPTTTNAEVVRVTAIATDTLTITRAQESSVARSVIVNDQIAANVTAKSLTDIETALRTASPLAMPIGGIIAWPTNAAPTGFLMCDGTAVSRATYSDLFALVGTTFGVGDGATTFNLPDLRQRIVIGKAAAGTVSTLGATTGSWDHTHGPGTLSVASHTHGPGTLTVASHTHDSGTLQVASHTHGAGTLTVASHTHGAGTLAAASHDHTAGTLGADSGGGHTHTGTTSSDGTHNHGVTLDSGATGPDIAPIISFTDAGAHTHTFTTSSDGAHTHTVSGFTGSAAPAVSGSTAADAPAVNAGTTGSTAPAVSSGSTGASAPAVSAGVTGGTAPAVTGGVTASANPPVLALNYIIRATNEV